MLVDAYKNCGVKNYQVPFLIVLEENKFVVVTLSSSVFMVLHYIEATDIL